MVALISLARIPDAVSVLEKINMITDTCYEAIDLLNLLVYISYWGENQSQLTFTWK